MKKFSYMYFKTIRAYSMASFPVAQFLPHHFMPHFGMKYNLAEIRKKLGLSQIQMAKLLLTTRAHISMVEIGQRTLTDTQLQKLLLIEADLNKDSEIAAITQQIREEEFKKVKHDLKEQLYHVQGQLNETNRRLAMLEKEQFTAQAKLDLMAREFKAFRNIPSMVKGVQQAYDEALLNYRCSLPCHISVLQLKKTNLERNLVEINHVLDELNKNCAS